MTTTTRVIVVGMNPSPRPPNKKVIKNSTVDRLQKWMTDCGVQHYSFINTTEAVKEKPLLIDIDMNRLKQATNGYHKVVALGGFASQCLRKVNVEHFVMPHPSPRNRMLNSKEYEQLKIQTCREYIHAEH